MKRIRQIIYVSLFIFALTFCSSCVKKDVDYRKEGYTSIVTFEFNEGSLENGVTQILDHIKYAYQPNSIIANPVTFPRYKFTRKDYEFLGWYKDAACTEKWDFQNDKIQNESITLYAKWEKMIQFTYDLKRKDVKTGNILDLYSYSVAEGETFEDYLNKSKLSGYTNIGFFKDPDCQIPWDDDFVHPGGDQDMGIPVYAGYIEGEYTLVSTYKELINATGNIYLLNDIDCEGNELDYKTFGGIFEGNNYTISNFVATPTTGLRVKYGVFGRLEAGTIIRNVQFENVIIPAPSRRLSSIVFAGLAGSAEGDVTIQNVKVSGKVLITDATTFSENGEGIVYQLETAILDINEDAKIVVENFTTQLIIEDLRESEE
ncbi:MAG: InlB B-repeat-containing protein [Prevotella sp.]|nr:InlB B-repeat-containing protein [Staphylococcus sp.]MCM1349697.1 InlB B-repeat-containing protein [Prevotella sp.]